MTATTDRRAALNAVKLRTLADTDAPAVPLGTGAALVADAGVAWVLLDDHPARLGAALAWAIRQGATALNVVAERGTGVLARRAAAFDLPIEVWHNDGRELLPAVAEPFATAPALPSRHESFRALITEAGATPLVESGALVGEVLGLEVCRVVDDAQLGTTRLEVGIGAHDREAFQMVHGNVPTAESLARVVAAVAEYRWVGAPPHPLNRLAAERLLREQLLAEPRRVGATSLAPAEPPVPRANLKDAVPCVAAGRTADGTPLVVVCAVGVDLDLVPYAADARLALGEPGVGDGVPELVIVTPARDQVPVIVEIAGRLRQPASFVSA